MGKKGAMELPTELVPHVIKEGEVLNPNGYPTGQKNARTIVKEFMNNSCDKLPAGSRVSRFQFLLWAVYESVFNFKKQVEYRRKEVKRAETKVKEAQKKVDSFSACDDDDPRALSKLEIKLTTREKELKSAHFHFERVNKMFCEASGKASEHFQKASGQYIDTKEVISTAPIIVTADKDDLEQAQKAIEDEL